MNAIGNFIPPALIFPRKNMKAELMDKALNGSVGFPQEKGYMNGETFLLWLKHFVNYANPGPGNKILLLLDGHASHKQLPVFRVCQKTKYYYVLFSSTLHPPGAAFRCSCIRTTKYLL